MEKLGLIFVNIFCGWFNWLVVVNVLGFWRGGDYNVDENVIRMVMMLMVYQAVIDGNQ